jgi:hypothetical protein
MSANPVQPYDYPAPTVQTNNDFNRKGHPGKFYKSISVSGSAFFTGSNYGAGAILPMSGSIGTAFLSGGGSIDMSKLTAGYIHELSVASVSGANNVIILIRNQAVR